MPDVVTSARGEEAHTTPPTARTAVNGYEQVELLKYTTLETRKISGRPDTEAPGTGQELPGEA